MLSLALGVHPVFDPDQLTGVEIGKTGDVAHRVDAGGLGPKPPIDKDSVVDLQAGRLGQRRARPHPGSRDDKIGVEGFAGIQGQASAVIGGRFSAEVEHHAVLLVEGLHPPAERLSHDLLQRNRFRRDDRHLESAMPKRRGHFQTDEACADHHDAAGAFGCLGDGIRVLRRPQHMDGGLVEARDRQPLRLGPVARMRAS